MSERAAPFYCPYCGDEDLRPHEQGHGAWLCGACRRAFTLKYLGLVFAEAPTGRPPTQAPTESGDDEAAATQATTTTSAKEGQ